MGGEGEEGGRERGEGERREGREGGREGGEG